MSEPSPLFGPQPLRSAMKSEEDVDKTPPASGTLKAVQIAEPTMEQDLNEDEASGVRKFRAGSNSRRMSGRRLSRGSFSDGSPAMRPADDSPRSSGQSHKHQYYAEKLLAQVSDWLEHAKQKKKSAAASRISRSTQRKSRSPLQDQSEASAAKEVRQRSDSIDSQSSDVSFGKLESILENSLASLGLTSVPQYAPKQNRTKRRNSKTTSQRAYSSDTDYVDGDAIVPSCDAWLDNSKTLSYGGGAATADEGEALSDQAKQEREAWLTFKNEILRIAHTLRLKGWRRIPLGSGDGIEVVRLSGALTNAVYVVTPPANVDEVEGKKSPTKVLLRIYGPQVEHLIDRDNELKVLARLARKKIGPRLLGTFKNGRFEQFFNAITLTPAHLREPETARQIAKRMRELHEGIELLPLERDGGPGIWRNWDAWVDNVSKIITYLDRDLETVPIPGNASSVVHAWKANGYVCGVPWKQFRDTVSKYRLLLDKHYKSPKVIKEKLVFSHNDTQYGNILRLRPDDEKSPLLQPANKHKQLVVIDFEYAAANLPGLEFANHFTEWTYNYHDPVTSYACNHERYPTVDQQIRFIKAYVDHRPQFPAASATPRMRPQDGASSGSTPSLQPTPSSSSIVDFMLDARVPAADWTAAERAREEETDRQVRELLDETRLWRVGNSAQWVAWGIVQAKVPGLDAQNNPVSYEEAMKVEKEIAADEFDYLSYAQSRAHFFWGDCVQMGLVKAEDLPEQLRAQLKIVEY